MCVIYYYDYDYYDDYDYYYYYYYYYFGMLEKPVVPCWVKVTVDPYIKRNSIMNISNI